MGGELGQGPKAGTKWSTELEEYTDPNTGVSVQQLTNYPGAQDRHLYFTADCWYDDGRRVLLRSRREGRSNLFSIDVETGVITQLTDLPQPVGDRPESTNEPKRFISRTVTTANATTTT